MAYPPRRNLLGSDRLLTTREVAERFGVQKRAIYRWKKSGDLKAYPTPGRHLRFRESEVRTLLEGGDK